MLQNGFAHFAEALVFVHGNHALAEASRHAELAEKSGDMESATRWRKAIKIVQHTQPIYMRQDC